MNTFDSIPIREPYNRNLELDKYKIDLRTNFNLPKKWVIKTLSDQISLEEAEKLVEVSDLTILLGRRDTQKKNESLNYAFNNLENWHQKYIFKEEKISDRTLQVSERQDMLLNIFSKFLDIEITYYEDLYFNESFRKQFSIKIGENGEKLLSYLNKDDKYRKENIVI